MKSKDRKSFINHSMVQMMCKMGGIGQRLVPAANLPLEISAERQRWRLSWSRPNGLRMGNFLRIFVGVNFNFFCYERCFYFFSGRI